MKSILAFIFTSTFCLTASSVFADTNAWYLGGNLGGGSSRCSTCHDDTITGTSTSTTGSTPALTFLGGYLLNRYFSVESGIGMLPLMRITTTYNNTTGSDQGEHSKTNWAAVGHIYIALKAMLPLTKQFSLFGKAGVDGEGIAYNKPYTDSDDDSNNSTSTSGVGTYLALGASYNFTPHIAGTGSYNQVDVTSGNTKFDSNYGALGVIYLF